MKELVHEADWKAMERKYHQLSGRIWGRSHELDIDNMEAAIKEVINKNSGENAIKAFSKFRFSETEGLSNQVLEMAEMVDEFFQEETEITAYKKDTNGKMMPDGPMYTKQLRDAFCIYKIFENIPEHSNQGYKGKIRELLQPALEDITKFNINTFIKELKKFETDWTMFEEKPKPANPTEEAKANLATKKKEINTEVVKKLENKANTENFTKTSYEAFTQEVDAVTAKTKGARLCYWCLKSQCVLMRQKQGEKVRLNKEKTKNTLSTGTN